jgi:uncharacterized protein (DUF305 family)
MKLTKSLITMSVLLAIGLSACSTPTSMPTPTAGMEHGKIDSHTTESGMAGMDHSTSMDLGPADKDYDLRFIDAMVPHHEGAVLMAKDALEKSKRPEIRTLAQGILDAQVAEISQMQTWRKAWYPQSTSTPMAWSTSMNHMMAMTPEQAGAMRMATDLGASDDDYDRRFLQAMIPHHQAAIVMAQDLSTKTQRPELRALAAAIETSQQTEIDKMQQWLKAWYS